MPTPSLEGVAGVCSATADDCADDQLVKIANDYIHASESIRRYLPAET